MEIGESWAYRARRIDPLIEVRIVKFGSNKPARVLVRFVAEEFEGREDWVPPARLKVPWAGAEEFEACEARWDAVEGASAIDGTPEDYATSLVFQELIDPELATVGYNRSAGVASIQDPDALARFLKIPADDLRRDPLSFLEGCALIVPWSITERIARRAAERNPEPLLRHVDKDEAEHRRRMIHGKWYPPSRGRSGYEIEAEFYVETEEEPYNRPFREVVRSWCGSEAVERRDEIKELRKEVARLGRLIYEAADALRNAGDNREAARIERELGVTVEELRGR